MLSNYFKIAFRTLLRFKEYSIINLIGLGLGITTGIFILLYVMDELSYDRFHTKADRIYRVGTDISDSKTGASTGKYETNGWPIGVLLKQDYPEVDAVIYTRSSGLPIIHEGKRHEEQIFYASEDFFKLFDFPLKAGNVSTALLEPNSIVITETIERKYFSGGKALGKTMVFRDTLLFLVTGVLEDIPSQSHMQFDILISFATYPLLSDGFSYDGGWGNINVRNYILLKEGVDKEAFFAKAKNLYMNYVETEMKQWGMFMYLDFEPLTDIYLKSKRGNGMGPIGSFERVYLVSGIAIFVIILACINFINLTTARASFRAKEVGLRKVAGSSRSALMRQFISESFVMTFVAFFLALALIGILSPQFNDLMGKNYDLTSLLQFEVMIGILLLIVVISFLSSYYPAIVLSGFRPAEVLKGKNQFGSRGVRFRQTLVIFQFMISAMLISFTLIINKQLSFMKNRDLGFSGDQILVLNISKIRGNERKPESFKNDLKNISSVKSVTFSNALPGAPGWIGQWAYAEEKSSDETVSVEYMSIDEDFIATLGLELVAGHNFNIASPAELDEGLIINERTVKAMNWDSPESAIGKRITSPSQYPAGIVIGVVKDYNEFGLQKEVYPMTMDYSPDNSRYFAIKFEGDNTDNILKQTDQLWKQYYEGYDFNYFFLDENFERQYQSEQRLSKVFNVFSAGSIIIAIIGLFGLVSFMVTTRTKEIGIRKVLGANALNISSLLSKEFLWLVLIANLIAIPLVWYFANNWLQDFAYRTTLTYILFVSPLAGTLTITAITISIQTIKASLADPVKSLRYE